MTWYVRFMTLAIWAGLLASVIIHEGVLGATPVQQLCRVRIQALNAAGKLLPSCRRGEASECNNERRQVYQALDLKKHCSNTYATLPPRIGPLGDEQPSPMPNAVHTYYVSPTGSDSNLGTSRQAPFLTLEKALAEAKTKPVGQFKKIILLQGDHRITQTINIDSSLSNLAIEGESNSPTSRPKLTTGIVLPRATNPCTAIGNGVVECTIEPSILEKLGELSMLFVNGQAAIRARTPNVKSPLDDVWNMRKPKTWGKGKVLATTKLTKRTIVPSDDPNVRYAKNSPIYDSFTLACVDETKMKSPFQPPCGYFIHPNHIAQGGCKYTVPTSATWKNNVFPSVWSNPKTALIHVLHWYGWGAWTFWVNSQNRKTVNFGEGGWQEARGDCNKGGQFWWVENVRELLDVSNEYFLDFKAGKLYYIPPSTDFNPALNPDVVLELTAQVRDILHIAGTSSAQLISNVFIRNVEFFGSYETTMDRFEMPSGGDWTYHRSAALHVENAQNVVVEDNSFQWTGGNAFIIGRRAENIKILRNSFYALGASAILVLGDPDLESANPWVIKDYPHNVLIEGNVASYIGRQVKQVSAVMISLARHVTVTGNVFYWGPRAGITMNDQWGGGIVISRNVVFEFVRTTSDHGPFILWHRQMYEDPTIKEYDIIEENLFIGNPGVGKDGGGKGINLDDGAHKIISRNNVLAIGFHKMKGSNLSIYGNFIVQPHVSGCVFFSHYNRLPGRQEFMNNTCISKKFPPYSLGVGGTGLNPLCESRDNFMANDNVFYVKKVKMQGCIKNWNNWRSKWKVDLNSNLIKTLPKVAEIDEMILQRLQWIPRE